MTLPHRPKPDIHSNSLKHDHPRRYILAIGFLTSILYCSAFADRPASYWNTPGGEFFDAGNWNMGLPNMTLDARIDNGGLVTITQPSFQPVQYVYLGSDQNTSGTLEISGEGSATFTTLIVGALNATGTLNIIEGGTLQSFGGPIGSDYLGAGFATVDGFGSQWSLSGPEMVIGGNSQGNLYVTNDGRVSVAGGDGRVQMANHPLSEGNLYIGKGGAAGALSAREIYNGEGRATVTFEHDEQLLAFSPKFTGVKTVNGYLDVRHEGNGTTRLTAPENNLAGTLTVAAGTLLVDGMLNGTVRLIAEENEVEELIIVEEKTIGTTRVEANGTLGGGGSIEGATTVLGTLSLGVSTGTLRFGGDLNLGAGGRVKMEIGGEVEGTHFESVEVAGALLYGGSLEIVFLDEYMPVDGTAFDLFEGFSDYSGTFSNIVLSAEGLRGSFEPSTGVLTVSTVPEPSAMALAALGFCTLGIQRKRSSR